MRELTCIICPIGCSLVVEEGSAPGEEGFTITGNRCPRGVAYAQEEIRAPKRVVTATCGIVFPAGEGPDQGGPHRSLTAPRRIPVKSSAPCPKDKIDELLGDIYRLRMSLPVKAGDKLIMDWEGSGINVIAVRNLE